MLTERSIVNGSPEFESVIEDVGRILADMLIFLKASDQRQKIGRVIFDPKGTNRAIKEHLGSHAWRGQSIPEEFSALGKDVDFVKDGNILEVQFSNYPFLLNNIIRSDIMFRMGCELGSTKVKSLIVVTKVGAFESSNSTLYFEQAKAQLEFLAKHEIIAIPVCILGISCPLGKISAMWTTYTATRYSRDVETSEKTRFTVTRKGARYIFTKS